MDVERHFGITLRQAEFRNVAQVRDLVAIIENRLRVLQQPNDLSLSAFNLLQEVVRGVVGDPDFRIYPNEQVADHLSPWQRRALWKQLREKLELKPASLELPWLLGRIVQGVYLRLVILTLWLSITVTGQYLIIGLVGIPIIAFATNPVIDLWRYHPPQDWRTFGDISTKLVGLIAVTKQTHLQTSQAIFAELRPLLVDITGCKPELVTMHAHLVQDLGLSC
jgi:hypothetical protein